MPPPNALPSEMVHMLGDPAKERIVILADEADLHLSLTSHTRFQRIARATPQDTGICTNNRNNAIRHRMPGLLDPHATQSNPHFEGPGNTAKSS